MLQAVYIHNLAHGLWVWEKLHPDQIKNNTKHPEVRDKVTTTRCNFGKFLKTSSVVGAIFALCSAEPFLHLSKYVCAELLKGVEKDHPSFFGKPFLPHSSYTLLLEPSSIIPCLPWPQGWEQCVQDRPLKFLPQGLLIWSRSRGFAFGSQTLER